MGAIDTLRQDDDGQPRQPGWGDSLDRHSALAGAVLHWHLAASSAHVGSKCFVPDELSPRRRRIIVQKIVNERPLIACPGCHGRY